MKKIKILRIITRLNIGGPAVHTALLTEEFNNNEFESMLVCGSISKGEGDMGYIAKYCGINSVYVPQLGREINPLLDLAAFYRIFKIMREYKPDIVHTHTAKAGTLGRVAAILTNVPVKVHTFHGNIFYGYFSRMATRFFILIEKALAKFTDAVIAISPVQEAEIVKKYKITNMKKCRLVRLGFDLEKFLNSEGTERGLIRGRFNLERDDILVGIVGRLTRIKNHRMFIDVVGDIGKHCDKQLRDKIKFVIIGGGELKEQLLEYIKFKGLERKIFFMGWFKNMSGAYADLDIVTLTSLNEGTPVSLIEAMASSKPVVSTDVGGVKDTIGDVGILVKSGDHKAMAGEILKLAFSPERRRRLGALGRDLVKDIYSKKRLVSELEALYKELLSKKSKPACRQAGR